MDPCPDFPAELKELPRWVCFALEPDPKHPEKPRKVPRQPRQPQYGAASTNPAHWSDYPTAVAAWTSSPCIAGIGYVFARGDGIVGVDLDDCLNEHGVLADWARPIASAMHGTYGEVSLNGRGLHYFAKGKLPPEGRKRGNVELYDDARFFVVTGRALAVGSPSAGVAVLLDKSTELLDIHTRHVAKNGKDGRDSADVRRAAAAAPALRTALPPTDDDLALLDRMFASANGHRIQALYRGDVSGYGDDHSAADLALVNHLLYWTDGDVPRADRLFRSSGLYRAKWDERRGSATYGQRTLATALASARTQAPRSAASPLAVAPKPAGWASRVLSGAAVTPQPRWWEAKAECR